MLAKIYYWEIANVSIWYSGGKLTNKPHYSNSPMPNSIAVTIDIQLLEMVLFIE
jgi:hypothetical protein